MWETIRGYLTFTRKERLGVLFLLAIIGLLFVLPYFFRHQPGEPDPAAYEKIKIELQKFEKAQADSFRSTDDHSRSEFREQVLKSPGKRIMDQSRRLFFFDPNTLKSEGWQRLGLSDHQTRIALHFVEHGGRFHKPEDLKRIYGLSLSEYEILLPYVRIIKEPESGSTKSVHFAAAEYQLEKTRKTDSFFNAKSLKWQSGNDFLHFSKRLEITDINQADSAQWSRLPGIGAKLASRIIHFRERLGGFYQVEQVGETFGLPDSGFQKIKPVLKLGQVSLTLLNLNNATKESLQSHPYIHWQIAKAIVEYRNQHGKFQSVEELQQLALVDSVNFNKLKPYLTVQP